MKNINKILIALFLLTGNLFAQKNFDVQDVEINVTYEKAFDFISKPENLPLWTNAFSKADSKTAIMRTPNGELTIKFSTISSKQFGIIDWEMYLPDGSVGKAFSRVSKNSKGVIYTFTLLAPPVPLEQLEGALAAQKELLAKELIKLKGLLEK